MRKLFIIAAILISASAAQAEFRHVQMKVFGMD